MEEKQPYFTKVKPRVLVIGDAAYPLSTTGFAIVCGKVIEAFQKDGWDVVHFARGLRERAGDEPSFRIYAPPAVDPNGYHYVDQIVEWEQPDLIFINADPGSIMEFRRNVQVRRIPNLVYMPTEGGPLLSPWSNVAPEIIEQDGRVVTYTEFSRKVILDAMPQAPKHEIEVLPHGIDHANFTCYPTAQRDELRKKLGWTNRFVVMNVARNAGRKNLPKLMEAVKLARESHPEISLYLHTVAFENHFLGGWNLMELRRSYEMDDCVQFHAELRDGTKGIAYADGKSIGLIDLYNAADVFVSTSGAEGWNLPMCEAAKCGLPVITPRYAGAWEVAKDWAVGIDVWNYETHTTGLRLASVEAEAAAEMICWMFEDKENREYHVQLGKAAASRMTWDPTVTRLAQIGKEMLSR